MRQLSHRLQVLIDDERLRRLEMRARSSGASVGALVREAIDVAYPGTVTDRRHAGESFLAADPVGAPAAGDALRDEIHSMWEGHL